MKLKRKSFNFEVKETRTDGTFTGYASVFDVLDSWGDVVKPGAFANSLADWKSKNRLPPVLWQHRSAEPVGPFISMVEDGRGLLVEGQLLVDDVPRAREARALLAANAISGMSIGFETVRDEWDAKGRVRNLLEIRLWEVSLVTFPANDASRVENIKSALAGGGLPTLPEFEEFLREAGFSKSQAAAIAGKGLAPLIRGEPGSSGSRDNELADAIVAAIKANPYRSK